MTTVVEPALLAFIVIVLVIVTTHLATIGIKALSNITSIDIFWKSGLVHIFIDGGAASKYMLKAPWCNKWMWSENHGYHKVHWRFLGWRLLERTETTV